MGFIESMASLAWIPPCSAVRHITNQQTVQARSPENPLIGLNTGSSLLAKLTATFMPALNSQTATRVLPPCASTAFLARRALYLERRGDWDNLWRLGLFLHVVG